MADFYAARAGTNAGAPLDGFLTAVHSGDEHLVERIQVHFDDVAARPGDPAAID